MTLRAVMEGWTTKKLEKLRILEPKFKKKINIITQFEIIKILMKDKIKQERLCPIVVQLFEIIRKHRILKNQEQ